MQRWLGAFPTPGPLPCSADTIYEDCGECPQEGRREGEGTLQGIWGGSQKEPGSHYDVTHPNQTVPKNSVQSLPHPPRQRDEMWSPGLPPSTYTRTLKVRDSLIHSFNKYLFSIYEIPLTVLNTVYQTCRYPCPARLYFQVEVKQ